MNQPSKILVVEDDRDIRHALEIRLTDLGYDVLQAADGTGALDTITSERPAAVLLDLGLADADGYAILERMRESSRGTPVIVLSGRDASTHEARCLAAGAAAYLEKPINAQRLAALLAELLPATETPPPAVATQALAGSPPRTAADLPRDALTSMARRAFLGRTILVVDDDEDIRKGLVVRLQSVGFETVTAADGMTAVQKCREHQPDVVLLDLGLPCGDGFKVIERIRELECVSQTPIVVLTGRNVSDDVERCLGAGAQEYLGKPVRDEDLLMSLADVLLPA